MEEQKFKVIIVEDVKLELKGTEAVSYTHLDVYKRQLFHVICYRVPMAHRGIWRKY